jgi:hypothetical protein
MQKIVNKLITSSIKGVDVYRWKDATWLIFTDETRWVVELTDEGTLWYNYKFFKDVFKYVSITIGTEMDGYIIQWANDFFYKDCAHRSAAYPRDKDRTKTSNVIENGIKETQQRGKNHGDEFEWYTRAVIGKGIKEVYDSSSTHRQMRAENLIPRIIKDSIKNIYPDMIPDDYDWSDEFNADKVIEGGVKL